jgi:hypothetical protein
LIQSIGQSVASVAQLREDMIQLGRSSGEGDTQAEPIDNLTLLPVITLILLRNMRSSLLQVCEASQRFDSSCPNEFDPKLRDIFWGMNRKAQMLLERVLNEEALKEILQGFTGRQESG